VSAEDPEAPQADVPGDVFEPRSSGLRARLRESLTDPAQVLAIVMIAALVARAIWLAVPLNGLIFDEAYYVNAARILLGIQLPEAAHYAGSPLGLDPNQEHPPLGKLLIALSMLAFGDNGLGWRLPSVVAGMIALGAVYLIVRAAGESRWLGVLAVGLLAFENLTLVHSRIGTLDMMVLAPILLGAWLGLRHRWLAAGALMGFGTLFKLTGLYGLAALLLWLALEGFERWRTNRRPDLALLRPVLLVLAGYVLVFGAGLTALDARFSSYAGRPLDHVQHMVSYGANLSKPGLNPTCKSNDSAPWQWLTNDCQMTYYRVDVTSKSAGKVVSSVPSIDFRGAMNPVLIGTFALGMSAAAWLAWRGGSILARWSLVWVASNYLPYLLLVVARSRITYIYYFLPVIPALAVAVALLLLRSGLPRFVAWGYLAAFALAAIAYYPFRQIP
jgi:predicted membrane-bound dolichyl-phosphate-mannose-protein mannosyltransferase